METIMKTPRHQQIIARSGQRARSGGSVIFIVSTTLALLGMMGLFAISAATREVKVSGYIRQSTQAHALSQATIQASAAYLDPNYAGPMIHDYATGRLGAGLMTSNCVSSAPTGGSVPAEISSDTLATTCLRVMDDDMHTKMSNKWLSSHDLNPVDPKARTGFSSLATETGFEITYPHQQACPYAVSPGMHCYRATVTTFAQVTAGAPPSPPPLANYDIQKTEMGRGHLVVGPFQD
jgi:hypothetical protein